MKIVIDLDEKYYNDIKNSPTASNYSTLYALFGIRNGTPLSDELENIKTEINAKERVELSTKEMWYNFALADVTHIIDNHIAELKGE